MRHIVDKIELVDEAIYLVDHGQTVTIKIVESLGGEDLTISTTDGNYIVVDSKLFIGSLKALVAKGDRDRMISRATK